MLPLLFLTLLSTTEPVTGTVAFKNYSDPAKVPETYRLDDHTFNFEMELKKDVKTFGYQVYKVRFPSPVTTRFKENNTVHCEWYRPEGTGPFPAVVVLDILGGDQSLARFQSTYLARKGIACLFVQMAYYGPRRPPGSKMRLMMPDLDHSLAAVRQTVLDVRRASAWLETRPEVDKEKLGLVGTSLGSFIGGLSAQMEPRFKRIAIVLGGGGLVDAFYDHPKVSPYRVIYELFGGTKAYFIKHIAIVDPITRAANLKDRQVLMIGASRDEIVPPSATKRLWQELGEPKIIWYDATHYTAALHMPDALKNVVEHFTK